MDYRDKAKELTGLGISVVPLRKDSKKPSIKWKKLQTEFLSEKEIEKHCGDCGGLAGITGKFSQLVCFDFDLDKQLLSQDFWKRYMSKVPDKLKKTMFVNQSRNGGYHIWFRVDFTDRSRKISHRALTILELYNRYKEGLEEGNEALKLSETLLNNPKECLLETRFEGSYAVLENPDYRRVYGKEIQKLSVEDYNFLLELGYSMDFAYSKPMVKVRGNSKDYKLIKDFNESATMEYMVKLLESTGLYNFFSNDYEGNAMLRRVGSKNEYSCKIYKDSAVVHDFGISNIFSDNRDSHNPFQTYCAIHNINQDEAIEKIKNLKKAQLGGETPTETEPKTD